MFSKSIRQSCPQCGAPVDFLKLKDMNSQLRAWAKEAEEFMGEPVASAWVCAREACAEVGFFGAVHVGF